MKHEKIWLFGLSAGSILCALAVYFGLLEINLLNRFFGNHGLIAVLLFALLALALLIFALIIVFKQKSMKFCIPALLGLISCVLAFVLADAGFLNKIGGDFLKHETDFAHEVERICPLLQSSEETSSFSVEEKNLFTTVPAGRVDVYPLDSKHVVYFFVAADLDNRTEGYVYTPDDIYPLEWNELAEWSEPLDIEENWHYVVLYKE